MKIAIIGAGAIGGLGAMPRISSAEAIGLVDPELSA